MSLEGAPFERLGHLEFSKTFSKTVAGHFQQFIHVLSLKRVSCRLVVFQVLDKPWSHNGQK